MQKKHRNKQKDILFVLISSFIVVVAWVSFNIYHIWVTSTVPNTISPQLQPIDPQFDSVVRQQLKSRERIDPLYDKQNTSATQTTQTPTPTEDVTNSASESSRFAPTGESINSVQGH